MKNKSEEKVVEELVEAMILDGIRIRNENDDKPAEEKTCFNIYAEAEK